jgi:hypothetical protein
VLSTPYENRPPELDSRATLDAPADQGGDADEGDPEIADQA